MKSFLKKYKWMVIGAGGLVLLLLVVSLVRNGNGAYEKVVVAHRDVVEEVKVSGTVEAGIVADLGFEVTGRVSAVSVKEGDTVYAGQTLVSLDLGTLVASRERAQAEYALKLAEFENAGVNLDEITNQQDTLVESAYRTLLSEGLVAVPEYDSSELTPPTITGLYTGEEGEYKLRIKRDGTTDDYELFVFNLDPVPAVEIDETRSTPIGTHGLFVSFPDGVEAYNNTTWYIRIPNKESSEYPANRNAYEEALRNRAVAIENAQAELTGRSSGASVIEAQVAAAAAEISSINAEIAQRILRAPFAGTVTQVYVDPGEIVSANATALTLISSDAFGIEVDLPEIDSIRVTVGDMAHVELDALRDAPALAASVVSVNRAETVVDGVPVYEARLAFLEPNDAIRSGMTTTVTISTNVREDVLAVPVRAVKYREDGTTYVLRGESKTETDVSVGLRGSDGFFEIISGLSLGDTVFIDL